MIGYLQGQLKKSARTDYMGIDHHKQYSQITLMDEKGKKPDKELLFALIKTFTHLEERRKEINGLVEKLYQEIPESRLIRNVHGYGIFLSVLMAVETADIERFSKVSKFLSYAGVIPSTQSSGKKRYHGKIVKEGNRWLR